MTRKLTRYSFVAVALALTSTLAFADTTAADVAQAVDQGQYHKADVLLHDVIQKHPRSARAHFMLAQVLGYEGRPADGLTELNTARALDSRASYANPARVKAVEERLEADERQQQPVAQANSPLPPAMTTAPVVMQPVVTPSKPVDSKVWIGAGLAVMLLVLFGVWMSRRARRKREEAANIERKEQLRSLTALLKTAESAKLDARLNSGDNAAAIASEATELRAHITDALTIVQSGRLIPVSDLQALDHRTQIVRARSLGQPTPSLSASADPGYVPRPSSVTYEPPYVRQPTYVPAPVVVAPSTIIVNQPSNDGFLTGMLVGEALSEPRYIERDVLVERDRDPVVHATPAVRDDYREPAHERDNSGNRDAGKDFDVGNGGSGWEDSSGGGIDAGGDGGWDDGS